MESNTNGSGALYRDAAIEHKPAPLVGGFDIGLAVLPPPRLETTADLVEWFDGDFYKWLMALDALIPRGGECAALASNILFDLVQLFPCFVECLRTGRLASIGVDLSAEAREQSHRVAELLVGSGQGLPEEDEKVATWLLAAARARAEAHEREAEHIAPEDDAGAAIESAASVESEAGDEPPSPADDGAGVSRLYLDYFDPALFPDLESVRAFVEGDGIDAMLDALATAAHPEKPVAPHVIEAARKPIYFLANDLHELIKAYIVAKPVQAELGGSRVEHGRNELALAMLAEGSDSDRLFPYLIDPPDADSDTSGGPDGSEAPEHAAHEDRAGEAIACEDGREPVDAHEEASAAERDRGRVGGEGFRVNRSGIPAAQRAWQAMANAGITGRGPEFVRMLDGLTHEQWAKLCDVANEMSEETARRRAAAQEAA